MNMNSIADWLARVGVPDEVVSVGREAEDAWCVLHDPGENGGEPAWEVFWREHGNRYDWARFSNEQVACFYLFGRLSWTQVLRGALGTTSPTSTVDEIRPSPPPVTAHEAATPPTGLPVGR
ncbi:hypothetical protein C1701_14515 [Actinoalloteichus sp. AHMU CJ021]|uniref:DUF317 domain-containing protein n=1 Tax=Actinoalloteichus caeruleus DSM 43889 TaxID=1120930 RepID=A0ABT1JPR0_ACTCY|nr:hypothetical protein [Actinoalloteichus caeruleus]AUS79376.1 hypothetical protein C1701_14515 [Actinoalloteichus sp. AHMU CJ021]MCP2333671.1 hypothetical protein [Actinoalloteichus caeruleus DSM 43889]